MTDPYRVLITGAREVLPAHVDAIHAALNDIRTAVTGPIIVVHGQCHKGGVDLVADQWAERTRDVTAERHPADWRRLGRRAGSVRNVAMVELGAAVCLGFPGPLSIGTWHCIRQAKTAGIPTRVYPLVWL